MQKRKCLKMIKLIFYKDIIDYFETEESDEIKKFLKDLKNIFTQISHEIWKKFEFKKLTIIMKMLN